ncbi:MAG: hypothetical protein B7C24_03060 [Bacteroidetes bacterium 4572_77]|nr:MAG: hypothetical protein B7C24_03060 [Bacteroidetes bacterium 4572_77]
MMKKSVVNISFLLVLFAFSLNNLFEIIQKEDTAENRRLNEKPVMDINELDVYPQAYNAYIDDNFSGRNYLVDLYGWINNHVFHKKSVLGKYIRGTDNFVFEAAKNLSIYTAKKTITNEQLDRMLTEFKTRQAYFDQLGIKMYILIIPSKYKVYSDKLPLLISKGKNNMGDRFIKHIQENTNIPIIDGYPVLKEKSKTENVYYKYDTHWNPLGSFYVHQALCNTIRNDFPSFPLMDTSTFTIQPFEKDKGNMKHAALDESDKDFGYTISPKNKSFKKINGYLHPAGDFTYGQYNYSRRYGSSHNEQPKALVFRDSFEGQTFSYLPEMFSEILYIWDDWGYKFNKDIVDIEKPDIIIYAIYEGYLDRILLNPSFVEADADTDEKDIQ